MLQSLKLLSKNALFLMMLLQYFSTLAQHSDHNISAEIFIGKTMPANYQFPKTTIQKDFFLSFGTSNECNDQEWVYRLNKPRTGISLGFYDFGNTEKLGFAYTIQPFIEFNIFKKWSLNTSFGASYFDKLFDTETNYFNRSISTHLNWNYKSFLYYALSDKGKLSWKLGAGYIHHSNGHVKLPNQGLNSFLVGLQAQLQSSNKVPDASEVKYFTRSTYSYFSSRAGLGTRTFSPQFNTQKPVYTAAFSYGKVINNTFKFGGGMYYRFYQHYYDLIKNEEPIVASTYPEFKEDPFLYASNFGVFTEGELLLNHVAMEFTIGINVYKPFYKLDYRINQSYSYILNRGEENEPPVAYGNLLDSYFKLKRTVSSRMGIKYYVWATAKVPVHNLFVGAHINANLGQADFSEISLGYQYNFNFKK